MVVPTAVPPVAPPVAFPGVLGPVEDGGFWAKAKRVLGMPLVKREAISTGPSILSPPINGSNRPPLVTASESSSKEEKRADELVLFGSTKDSLTWLVGDVPKVMLRSTVIVSNSLGKGVPEFTVILFWTTFIRWRALSAMTKEMHENINWNTDMHTNARCDTWSLGLLNSLGPLRSSEWAL